MMCFARVLGLLIIANPVLLTRLKLLIDQNLAMLRIIFSNYFESEYVNILISKFPIFKSLQSTMKDFFFAVLKIKIYSINVFNKFIFVDYSQINTLDFQIFIIDDLKSAIFTFINIFIKFIMTTFEKNEKTKTLKMSKMSKIK